ncbi:membrane alanyl aminopeptidase-like [Diabrotica virgifera virgifera]|uniref:Aminopeptidase n=1 Tax=Diabrotica virgifera virgifera TaxID=50390 RepID=A0ABM5K9S4_DIAVI|nr:membrane alanyl aminopeptidase-like [Diabrotica virgifera virgifera]
MTPLSFLSVLLVFLPFVYLQEYRLPKTVVPSHYALSFTFNRQVFAGTIFEFSGSTVITIKTSESVANIQLHADPSFLRIGAISLDQGGEIDSYNVDAVTQILTITTKAALNPEIEYKLTITYRADISTKEMIGLYQSTYQDANQATNYLVATQLEPTYARRVFPCFDEPSFKATFQVSFTLGPNITPRTNTKLESSNQMTPSILQYTFVTTPVMSTYLLSFVISNLDCTDAATINGVQNSVCSRPGTENLRDWAVNIAPKILASLGEYTKLDYNLAMNKMDYVAIPDFSVEAMENWGLSTYREQSLLYDPEHSTNIDKQNVATLLAHEIAHQWFGNLVTCNWWSETFLNEAFGDYFEYFAAHMILPAWQLDKQHVVNNVQKALRADEGNLPALQSTVSSPVEILGRFNVVSYTKGSSILRMVEHILGSENFKDGIYHYLNSHKFKSTTSSDLWRGFQAYLDNSYSILPNYLNLGAVMNNWVVQSGFPLVTVTVSEGNVQIEQRRFGDNGTDDNSKWYVPITFITSGSSGVPSTRPSYWLTPENNVAFQLPQGAEWIIVNNLQTGYYRVNYDTATWNKIEEVFKSNNFGSINEITRAQIVDDLFSLANIGEISYSRVLKFLEFLSEETSYFTWTSAFNGFQFLFNRLQNQSNLTETVTSNVLSLMDKLYKSTPFDVIDDDNQVFTLKKMLTLSWACQLGHPECLVMSRASFLSYKLSGVKPQKNLRSTIYCTALQTSSERENWDFLLKVHNEADLDSERPLLLKSLACTQNKELLQELLLLTIADDSPIAREDCITVLGSVAANSNGAEQAFDFVINNYDNITQRYQATNTIANILEIIGGAITTEEQVDKFRSFINGGQLPKDYVNDGERALEIAQKNLNWSEKHEKDLINHYYPESKEPDEPQPYTGEGVSIGSNGLIIGFIVSYLLL